MEMLIFKQKVVIPKEVGVTTAISISSFSFKIDIDFTRIIARKKNGGVVNVRIFVNKTLTNTADFMDEFIMDKPYEFQRVIIASVFNHKFSTYIIRNIQE